MLRILAYLFALVTASAVALPPPAEPLGRASVVAYLDADNERVTAAISKFEAAMARRSITARHRVSVKHIPVNVLDRAQATERIAAALRERPAIVIATSSESASIAKALTSDVPIIFGSYQDPIRMGLVRSLADPDGNLTGFTFFVPIDLKRLELLREIAPHAKRLGIIVDRWWMKETDGEAILRAAKARLGFDAEVFQLEKLPDLRMLDTPAARAIDVWYVPPTTLPFEQPVVTLRALGALRKPVVFPAEKFVDAGGLMTYQPKVSLDEALDLFAKCVGLVLDGVPASEIPVERPKSFELVVNVSEARRLGISLPDALLKRADRVIDEPIQADAR